MKITTIAIATSLAGLASCGVQFKYTPPGELTAKAEPARTLPVSFDTAWKGLISGIGSEFFAIKNFEKDSGLLILEFGAQRFSDVVDGGTLSVDNTSSAQGTWLWTGRQVERVKFDGPFVDFVQEYGGSLSGVVNLVARPETAESTTVTANIRYVLRGANRGWDWRSKGKATQMVTIAGEEASVTVQSTGLVESKLHDAILKHCSQ